MINRRMAMSGMSILTALGLLAGSTLAAFSSQATSTDNVFASGNAALLIAADTGGGEPAAGVFAPTINGPDFANLFPGFSSNTDFWLKNNSSSAISLDVLGDLAVTAQTPGPDTTNDLRNNLLISWVCDTDDNGSIGDNTPSSEFSVDAWETGGNAGLGTIVQGNAIFCRMIARVPGTAGDDIQDDSLTFTALYDATQTP